MERSRSVARWGEIGVADPGCFGVQSKHSRMGEIRVVDLGVWSVVGRGEFGVIDLGFLCLEPPSLAGT